MPTDSRLSPRPPAFFSQLYVRLVVIVLFVLIPALILALLTTVEQNRVANDAARQQAIVLTQLTAANHEQLVSGTERVLIALAQTPEVSDGDTAACNALFVQLREKFESYTNFFTVDIAGDVVCTGLPDAAPVNVLGREWFERAQKTNGFSIADYALGVVSGRPVLTFSYPIHDDTGQKKYYLGASLSLEWMNTFIESSDFPPNTTVTAIDRVGTILYRYPDGEVWVGKKYPIDSVAVTIFTEKTGTVQDIGLDGVERLFGFVPLDENVSAFIIVGLSQDVVFAQSRALLIQNLLSLAAVGIVTLIVAVYGVNRLLVSPIRTLAHTTVRLAGGDLKTRVNLNLMEDTQELVDLGSAFNTMAASLEQAHEGLETKVRERTQELTLLAEASSTLASSLDYERSLKTVTRFIVPVLADWCAVDVLNEEGTLDRLAIAHIDPQKVIQAEEIHRLYPPDPTAPVGLYHTIRSREASHYPDITDALLVASAKDERHLSLLRELGLVSSMSVPLIARDRVLGVITFVSSTPERHFTSDDVKLAKELARRAATTIDNAYLYREMQKQRKQLQVTLFSIGDAVIATDIEGKIIFINPVGQQVTGWREEEAIGKPLIEVFRIVSESTGEMIESPFDKVVREGKIVGLANHTLLIARDGTRIPIDDSGAPIFDETQTLTGVILVFRDITERRQNERQLSLLFELTTAFSQALTSNEVAEVMVERGSKALEAVLGTVCLLVENGTQLEIINRHSLSPETFERYRRTPLDFSGPLNDAVRTDTIVWIETAEDYKARYPHFADAIRHNGTRSSICIPLKVNEKMIGGFNLSFSTEKPHTSSEEAFFTALAQQCAQSLERARLYDAEQKARQSAEDAQKQLAFLAEASAILATSLEAHHTLTQITNLIVPTLAESAHIDLLRDDGTIDRLAIRHTDPEKEADLYELNRLFPIDPQAHMGPAKVIRTGSAELVSVVPEGLLDSYAKNERHLELMQSFKMRSYIIVPLTVRGKTFGALTFTSSVAGSFTVEDLTLLEEFGRRAALSVANAQLYQAEQGARAFADQNLQRVTRLQAATAFLSEALTVEQVSSVTIEHTTYATNATSSVLALLKNNPIKDNPMVLGVMATHGYDPDVLPVGVNVALANISPAIMECIRLHTPVWFETSEPTSHPLVPKDIPEALPQIWTVLPLNSHERTLGLLLLSMPMDATLDDDDKAFLITLTQQCAQALERALLYEQAKDVAALQERQRLARDLHDAVSQVLFSSTSIAEIVPRIWERDQNKAFEQMKQVVILNRAAMAEMRSLLLELRPEAILRTNLNQLIEQLLRAVRGRKAIETEFISEGEEYVLPPEVHVAFYRIAQEAINNIVKHSQAKHITVSLTITTNVTSLHIVDDGLGFEVGASNSGIGLHTMKERAGALGIQYDLQSQPNSGTRVTVVWHQV